MGKNDFNPLLKENILFRPLSNLPMLRYSEGKWLPDDGTPDLAFVTISHNDPPFAFHVNMPHYTNILWQWRDLELERKIVGKELEKFVYGWHIQTTNDKDYDDYRWRERDNHPNTVAGELAMKKCCSLFSCANGRGPNLTSDDLEPAYFAKSLLWVKSTMIPIRKPENPVCFLCLNDGEGHKREASKRRYFDCLRQKIDAEERHNKAESDFYDTKGEVKHYAEKLEQLKVDPFYRPEWDEE